MRSVSHALVIPLQLLLQRIHPAHPVGARVRAPEANSHTAGIIDCDLAVSAVVKDELAATLNASTDLKATDWLNQKLIAASRRHFKSDVAVDLSTGLAADAVQVLKLGVGVVSSSIAEQDLEIAVAVLRHLH